MYIRSSPRGPNRDPNRTLSNELLLIRCLAELNIRSHLALINGIANILKANWVKSSYER